MIDLGILEQSSRAELLKHWKALFGDYPPSGMSRPMMARIIGFEVQMKQEGGLKKRTLNRLLTIAKGDKSSKPNIEIKSGTRLVREWNGISHVVDVSGEGILYKAKSYKSLSAVAKEITGSHWSGPRFFGLTNRKAN